MRRVLALLIGAAIVVVAGGVAEAAITHRQNGPFGILASADADERPASGAARPEQRPAGKAKPAERTGGEPLTVGTLESVTQLVDFATHRRTVLHYPNAEYVKPHFSRLILLPGQYVRVSTPQGRESRLYSAEGLPIEPSLSLNLIKTLPLDVTKLIEKDVDKAEAGDPAKLTTPVSGLNKWAMSVPGDTAIVELVSARSPLPTDALSGLGVNIDKVAKGTPKADVAAEPRTESVCQRDDKKDAVCYQSTYSTEFEHSKPVARLLVNGVELCTGWRIGPNNRMITNQHCIASDDDAAGTEIWFNYQCQTCGSVLPVSEPVTKVMGDRLLATDDKLDFSLFTVKDFESIRSFGYLEFDDRKAQHGEEIYIPQHPGGAAKQLAITSDRERGANCAVDDPTFEGYGKETDVSYFCDTEGGSSGSPVLSRRTHKVLALHHFGGCPNSGVRIDLISRKIANKL